jgi:RNA polymerase sigma-70 factor, ECF subfamily
MKWNQPAISSPVAVQRKREPASRNADSDASLFSSFLAGDDKALVALFDRHNHRLFHYCLQLVRDTQRAEDVTQELWERVIKLRADRRATAENPLGLLLTIARNLCLDDIRKQRHHAALDELPEASHPAASIPELSHLEELVILALPHLPLEQREVLILSAYSGYRFDEIAAMLGESVGTVRTRAWRARAHLGRIISAMIGMNEDSQNTDNGPRPRKDR